MVSVLLAGEVTRPSTLTTTTIADATVAWTVGDAVTEYEALRQGCGLIDTSAGGPVRLTGDDAAAVLQRVLARDVEFLPPERALTSLLLDDGGAPVDVVTVLAGEQDYLVLTGPGSSARVTAALVAAAAGSTDVTVVDEGDTTCVFSLEGPRSWRVLADVLGAAYAGLGYENVLPIDVEGSECLVGRLGVTGEYGYTLVAPTAVAASLWTACVSAGAVPTGHQARETAMLEVRQPVLHREVTPGDTVLTAGLNWLVELSKEEFVGRQAVVDAAEQDTEGPRPIGFDVVAGVVAAGDRLFVDDVEVGTVITVVDSPGLGAQLGLARVERRWQAARLEFTTIAGDTVRTLAPPYVVPQSWTVAIAL